MSTVTITNTGKATIGWAGNPKAQMQPGENEVPADIWSEAKKHKVIQHHLDEGTLVEGSVKKKGRKSEPVKSEPVAEVKKLDVASIIKAFAKLSESEAIESAKTATDLDVLNAVFEAEKRKAVSEALAARIEALEKK